MKISEVMTPTPITIRPSNTLWELKDIFDKYHVWTVIVAHEGKVDGIVTHNDFKKKGKGRPYTELVSTIMTENPKTIDYDSEVETARQEMDKRRITALPVLKGGKLVGIVTLSDIDYRSRDEKPSSKEDEHEEHIMPESNLKTKQTEPKLELARTPDHFKEISRKLKDPNIQKVLLAAGAIILLLVISVVFQDYQSSLVKKSCSDGTLPLQCSLTKPLYCSNGALTNNASACGCPAGYFADGNSCNQKCNDGTNFNSCSRTKPLFCEKGQLLEKSSSCGCPTNKYVNGDGCVNSWWDTGIGQLIGGILAIILGIFFMWLLVTSNKRPPMHPVEEEEFHRERGRLKARSSRDW